MVSKMPAILKLLQTGDLPTDIETRPIEDRAAFAAELRRLADALHAEADRPITIRPIGPREPVG
jgi:hypothetical protein